MFGYVKVNSAELRVKEYELYKSTYCGLCRSMGKCTGQCSRMTLSYDFAFLAMVRFAIENEKVEFERKRCLVHPLKKRNSVKANPTLRYCAAASAILTYQKCKDDLSDERGLKKLRAVLAYPFAAHARKKALKRLPQLCELDKLTAELLVLLERTERDEKSGVDAPAEVFGRLLGEIMSFGLEGTDARVAYSLGTNIGAWIYIADAIDDAREDLKRNRYNPLLRLYGGRAPDARELSLVADALKNHLYGAEAAFDLIDVEDISIKNVIQNILYIGIPDRIEAIIRSQTQDGCDLKKCKRKEEQND